MSNPEEKDEKVEDPDEVYEKLKRSNFKQQRLPAWRPVPTIMCTTIIFTSFGVIFIILGIVILVYSSKVVEISKEYGSDVSIGNTGTISLTIEEDMDAPIMVYYQLDGFYQNHRRYVKSKSDDQLHGESFTYTEMKDNGDCDPVISNEEMGQVMSFTGKALEPNELAVPCGLIAKSYFNDIYTKWQKQDGREIYVNENDISWSADKEIKFKNTNNLDKQWINMTDEHFMVWMRPAGLPNFRKLWGRIEGDAQSLKEGDVLTITYKNNYDVSKYKGKKHIVLSTVNGFGGKNNFLGISYIVVGGICIILAIVFMIGYKMHENKIK